MIGKRMEIISRMACGCVMNVVVLMSNGDNLRNLNEMLDNGSLLMIFDV